MKQKQIQKEKSFKTFCNTKGFPFQRYLQNHDHKKISVQS